MLASHPFRLVGAIGENIKWEALLPHEIEPKIKDTKERIQWCVSAQWFRSQAWKEAPDHWAHFFGDIDDKEATGKGLEYARKIARYLWDTGLKERDQLWLSTGSGGFHWYANAHAFGTKPSPHVTSIWKPMTTVMCEQLSIPCGDPKSDGNLGKAFVDLSVYSMPRLMRLPGTIHKSGKRCRRLSLTELTGSIEEILS